MPGAARSPGLRVSEAPVLRLFGAPELFCVGSCSGLRILEVLHFLARLGLGLGRLRRPELLGLNGVTEENVTSSWESARRVDSELSGQEPSEACVSDLRLQNHRGQGFVVSMVAGQQR